MLSIIASTYTETIIEETIQSEHQPLQGLSSPEEYFLFNATTSSEAENHYTWRLSPGNDATLYNTSLCSPLACSIIASVKNPLNQWR